MENRVERRAARAGVGRRRLLRTGGIMGGGLAAAFLAACGGGDNKPAAQSTSAPSGTRAAAGTTAAGGTTVAAATKPTGTVTVVQGVDANTLDPSFTNATPEANILYHVFETVLWRDPKTLLPAPRAAASFKNVDPLTWEFKLNPNMKFHDGTPADAEAAKFSIDRVAKAKIGDRNTVPSFARQVNYEETQVVDAVTFRIKLKAPSAILTDQLTSVPLLPPSVYNDESADNLAKVAQKPIGSGAWKFVEWKKDQQMVFDVNPAYYGAPPAFEKVIFKPVGETSTRILQLKNGEADVIVNVPPDNAADIDKSDKARISSVDGLRKIFVGLRADRNKALADKRVRQAINYALNWDAISRALLNGKGQRMKTLLNPPHEPPDAKAYTYDVNKAKSLLAEAGYGSGLSLTMHAPSGRYIKDKELAQAVAQDLEKAGIKVELQVLEWSVYAGQELQPGKGPSSDMYFVGLGAPVTGQDELNFVHKDYSLNFTGWTNDEYLKLFDQLKAEMDDKKRQDLMNQAHKIVWDEAPWLWIYNQVDFYGASKKLVWDARPDERIAMFEAKWKA